MERTILHGVVRAATAELRAGDTVAGVIGGPAGLTPGIGIPQSDNSGNPPAN